MLIDDAVPGGFAIRFVVDAAGCARPAHRRTGGGSVRRGQFRHQPVHDEGRLRSFDLPGPKSLFRP